MSGLSASAFTSQNSIRQTIVDQGDGTYAVRLGGKDYRVDADLPTVSASSSELSMAGFGKESSIWVPLVEKAYAYHRTGANTYASLEGGGTATGLEAVGATNISWKGFDGYRTGEEMLEDIAARMARGQAVGVGFSDQLAAGAPVFGSHAYNAFRVVRNARGKAIAVVIRNPWGVEGERQARRAPRRSPCLRPWPRPGPRPILAGMTIDLPEAPITSIQPGGGTIFALERAWGRLRRGLLRLCFPGYVRRMAGLRQGECPNCPHNVIDPRDLKFVRNTCGYWFRPEDDAFAWRGRLGLARPGLAELVCASLVLLPLVVAFGVVATWWHPAWWVGVAVLLPLWLFILSFFRDPHRAIPAAADVVVSPADGVVTHLEEVDEPGFAGKAFRVSIFLSVFNVHVNRVPRSSVVTRIAYYPGEFLDARDSACPKRNEQLWLDLKDDRLGCPIRVKQIAGAIARRIVCWLKAGESLRAGERFGMIKFGSRTEVLLPADVVAEVTVKVGQSVKGGRDVLLRVRDTM